MSKIQTSGKIVYCSKLFSMNSFTSVTILYTHNFAF